MTVTCVEKKIKEFDRLCRIVSDRKQKGKKVVQCHGIFDIIHPGIVRHVESAKKQGDLLVVTVVRDSDVRKGPNYPIFSEKLRAENVASIGCVDYVSVVGDNPSYQSVKTLRPNVFARGQDYKDRNPQVTEKLEQQEQALRLAGCEVHNTPGETFSTTEIANKFLDIYPDETKQYLRTFARKYKASDIAKAIKTLSKLRILLVGDTIVDEYHYCEPMGKSLKEPLVVYRYLSEEVFPGGTLAVANHLAGICKRVQLVSLLGQEQSRQDFALNGLKPNVRAKMFHRKDASTIVKRRFINEYSGQKLFEVCYLKDDKVPDKAEKRILEYLSGHIGSYDLVMVCDFGHGLVTKKLIRLLEKKARKLAVNVQANGANIGFNIVTKYHNVSFTCLDEAEARLACRDKYGDIKQLAKTIAKHANTDYLIVTRGNRGSIGINSHGKLNTTPAFSSFVVDRIGAGDAFFSFTAPCFAVGLPLDMVSFIGNAVGALAVQIVCNREPVEPEKLYEFIHTLLR